MEISGTGEKMTHGRFHFERAVRRKNGSSEAVPGRKYYTKETSIGRESGCPNDTECSERGTSIQSGAASPPRADRDAIYADLEA